MTAAPRARWGHDRYPDRRLGRPPHAGGLAALSPAGAARPTDRHLALAVSRLVGRGAGGTGMARLAADGAVRDRRRRHARRRLHAQRHRRPGFRRARRAHPHAADRQRRHLGQAGIRLHGAGTHNRRGRAAVVQPCRDRARPPGAGADRDLSVHEANHLLAAVLPRPQFQLGRTPRLGGGTIYAHQDRDDDALIGVKSSALALGLRTRPFLFAFYAGALALWAAAGVRAADAWPYWLGLACAAAQLCWQAATVDIDDGADCLAKFRSNRAVGWCLLIGIVAAHVA